MKKRNIILGLALASVSVGTLFAAVTNNGQVISMEKAKAIAENKVPGATITSIELEHELKGSIYEIEMYLDGYEYDLKLNATTGEGISVCKEQDDDLINGVVTSNTLNKADLSAVRLTEIEAQTIALQQVPDATTKKIELEEEDGQLIYEIELRKENIEYDVEIDAITGTVLKCKVDD